MDLHELVKSKRAEIQAAASRHGARNLRVFGSVARGEAGPASDLDLLVELEPGRTLLDMGRLLMDLQDLLGVQVDLVEPEGLAPPFRQHILQEAVAL